MNLILGCSDWSDRRRKHPATLAPIRLSFRLYRAHCELHSCKIYSSSTWQLSSFSKLSASHRGTADENLESLPFYFIALAWFDGPVPRASRQYEGSNITRVINSSSCRFVNEMARRRSRKSSSVHIPRIASYGSQLRSMSQSQADCHTANQEASTCRRAVGVLSAADISLFSPIHTLRYNIACTSEGFFQPKQSPSPSLLPRDRLTRIPNRVT